MKFILTEIPYTDANCCLTMRVVSNIRTSVTNAPYRKNNLVSLYIIEKIIISKPSRFGDYKYKTTNYRVRFPSFYFITNLRKSFKLKKIHTQVYPGIYHNFLKSAFVIAKHACLKNLKENIKL